MAQENRAFLKQMGTVVYLSASLNKLYKSTHRDKNRPLLQGTDDLRKKIEELLAARLSLYKECADLTVETENKSKDQIVNTITSYSTSSSHATQIGN